MTNRTVNFTMTGTADPLIAELREVQNAIRQIGATASADIGKLSAALETTSTAAGHARTGVTNFFNDALKFATGTAIVGAITGIGRAFTDVGGNALNAAGDLKQTRIGFETLMGSASAAREELTALQAIGAKSPLEQAPINLAAQELLGVGESAKAANREIVDLANATTAIGKGSTEFARMAENEAQVVAAGRLMTEDAQNFASAGLPVWQILGEYLHVSTQAARDLTSAGEVTAEVWNNALHAKVVEDWGNAAERASQSWNGLLSTAGDALTALLQELGGPVIDSLEPKLRQVIDLISSPQALQMAHQIGVEIAGWADQAWRAAQILAQSFGVNLTAIATQTTALAAPTAEVGKQWNTISIAAGDTKGAIAALQDQERALQAQTADRDAGYTRQLTSLRAQSTALQQQAQDVARARDAEIAGLRDRNTLLDRAFTRENEITRLHHTERDLQRAQDLSKNIFSSAGRAAAEDVPRLQEERLQELRQIGHEDQKAAIDDQIRGIERQKTADEARAQTASRSIAAQIAGIEARKQAEDQAAQAQSRAIAAQIRGIEAEAQQYAQYNQDKIAAIKAYQAEAHTSITVLSGAQTAVHTLQMAQVELLKKTELAAMDLIPFHAEQIHPTLLTKLFGADGEWLKTGEALAAKLVEGALGALAGVAGRVLADLLGTPDQQQAAGASLMDNVFAGLRAAFAGGSAADKAIIEAGAAAAHGDPGKAWTITREAKAKEEGAASIPQQAAASGARVDPTDHSRIILKNGAKIANRDVRVSPSDPRYVILPNGDYMLASDYYGPDPQTTGEAARRRREERADYVDGTRAGGGPVLPGGRYLVGENGPELLQMGRMGGMIAPTPFGGDAGLTVTHLCPACLTKTVEAVIDRSTPRIDRNLGNLWGGA